MADYAFRSIEDRRKIEGMWNAGRSPKEISADMGTTVTVIYTELARGRDGTCLPDQRLRYSAELAQRRVHQSLKNRGRKTEKATGYGAPGR